MKFAFSCAPLLDSEPCSAILSESTRRSMARSEWVRACSQDGSGDPEVYLCEAFGGASEKELAAVAATLAAKGKFLIVVWSGDHRFQAFARYKTLLFEVGGPGELACTYGWEVYKYGPHQLSKWLPFDERPILASFVGSRRTHPVREILFSDKIKGRTDIVVEDFDWWSTMADPDGHEVRVAQSKRYAETLERSKFSFCPRGNGPSSKRRWESPYLGAIPILMDDATKAFGLEVPGLNFVSDPKLTADENAARLLEALSSTVPLGAKLQNDLASFLPENLDMPAVSPIHTTVMHIVRVANETWVQGGGFQPD